MIRTNPAAAGVLALLLAAGCAPAVPAAAPAPEPEKRVRIVHTNDFHGRLAPERAAWADGRLVGGSAVLAAHFDSAAARFDGPTLVLSAGDDLQGTVVSNLSFGRATVEAHNAAGYAASVFGNHEFDWGQDTLAARVGDSAFPWLAANLYVAGTREHPAWVRPWVMIERDGVRVAVIGAAYSETPELVMAGRLAGLEFGAEAPAIDAAAREARAAGADFVVVAAHVGATCEDAGEAPDELSAGCEGDLLDIVDALREPVDLVLGAHTHVRVMTRVDGVPVAEARNYGRAYSVTDLRRERGRSTVIAREIRVPFADEVDPDTQVARIVAGWQARVEPLVAREVVTLAAPLPEEEGEYALGNLIADALRHATGAHASLVNTGSIRRGLPAGPVTWGMLFELQPFGNEVVTLEVTGAQLRAALENALSGGRPEAHVSGMTVAWDPSARAGSRVREVRLADGRLVEDDAMLTLALSEFVATGGDEYDVFEPLPMTRSGTVDLDALIAYLRTLPSPVRGPDVGRWMAR